MAERHDEASAERTRRDTEASVAQANLLRNWVECPNCGDVAAECMATDGDPLMCGCPGHISVDAESELSVNIDDEIEIGVSYL